MSLDLEIVCSECDELEVYMCERDGLAFTYSWFECRLCQETDWHSKRLKKKGLFKWVNLK